MAAGDPEKCYNCKFCTLKLETYTLWCRHLHEVHNVVFLQCEYCSRQLPSKSELLRHVKSKHTDGCNPRVECSTCPSTFVSLKGLERHINQKHKPNQQTFTCEKCNKTYKSRSTYNNHLKISHLPLTYIKCDKCPKIFYKKQNLKRHKEVEHSANFQRTQCPICPATYKYREYLGRHMHKKHFSQSNNYSETFNFTTLMSDNKCNICSALFVDKVKLLEHRKTFHNRQIDIFCCDKCNAVFKIPEAYEHHLQEEHRISAVQPLNVDNEDYTFQEYVDFEHTIMQNFELRQLIKIRKSRKFSQKLIIVTYNREQSDDASNLSNLNENEMDTILKSVNSFFHSLVGQYRSHHSITTIKDIPIEFCPSNQDEHEQKHSETNFLEFHISDQNENSLIDNKENNLPVGFDVGNVTCTDEDANDTKLNKSQEFIAQENGFNVMQNPKIMFNCLECTELFPDEELLWNHLTSIHKKAMKKPVSLATLEIINDSEINNHIVAKNNSKEHKARANVQTDVKVSKRKHKDAKRTLRSKIMSTRNRKPKAIIVQNNKPKAKLEMKKITSSKANNLCKKAVNKKNRTPTVQSVITKSKHCTKCGTKLKTKVQLKSHNNSDHVLAHKCNNCHRYFKLKANLARHVKYSHKKSFKNSTSTSKNTAAKQNEKSKTSKEGTNIETDESLNLMFPCEHCQALFPCIELLLNHCSWQHNQ